MGVYFGLLGDDAWSAGAFDELFEVLGRLTSPGGAVFFKKSARSAVSDRLVRHLGESGCYKELDLCVYLMRGPSIPKLTSISLMLLGVKV